MTDWTILLSGAAGAAAIKLLDGVVQWALGRLGKRGDKKHATLVEIESRLKTVEGGSMALLLDRIQHLCKAYIAEGSVDADDLRRLHIMHDHYHKEGGNGDLDKLMQRVDMLPLKE